MKVLMIGKTGVDLFDRLFDRDSRYRMPGKAEGSEFEDRVKGDGPSETGQELIEFAGRLCYESFNLPNEKTKENSGYVQNIISLGHESVLEHVSVTFYVEGVSRNLSHELIRHRHLSFSELSQRYVDMRKSNFVNPPAVREYESDEVGGEWRNPMQSMSEDYLGAYEIISENLEDSGKSRKQAREAARYYLPAGTETKFVVTGNLRAWRDVLKKRFSVHADAEMQEFARDVYTLLSADYPDVFKDITYDFGDA